MNEKYIKRLLKSRKAIVINDALMRALSHDSTRDLFKGIGDWGYTTDFGRITASADNKVQSYIRAYLQELLED